MKGDIFLTAIWDAMTDSINKGTESYLIYYSSRKLK